MSNKKMVIKNYVSRIVAIAESDESNVAYMTVDLVLFDNQTNLNGVHYSKEFINDIVTNKDQYVGTPVVAEQKKLDDGDFDDLTHAYNPETGMFETQIIGSFVDFSTKENGDLVQLCGEARIPKRNGRTCSAIQELYDNDNLKFSYEIMIADYKVENGIKYVDVSDNNRLLGMCIVSNPAVPSAKAYALVAAIEQDKAIALAASENGVVPSNVSTVKADENTSWSAPTLKDFTDKSWSDLTSTEKKKITGHYAWAKENPPKTFGDLKLPHHEPSDGKVVLAGVEAAAQRLNQTDLPSGILNKVKSHLAAHYHQFKRKAPWENEKSGEMDEVNKFFANCENHIDKAEISTAELSFEQVEIKLFHAIRDYINNQPNDDYYYNYSARSIYSDYVILLNFNDGNYYKVSYTVSGNDVIVNSKTACTLNVTEITEPVTASRKGEGLMFKTIEEAEKAYGDQKKLLDNANTTVAAKDAEIATANAKIIKLGEDLTAKDKTIAELTPYKEKVTQIEKEKTEAELAEKKKTLKSRCEAILDEKEMKDVAELIEKVDEAGINKILADKYVAKAEAEKAKKDGVATGSRITDSISTKPNDVLHQYITIGK